MSHVLNSPHEANLTGLVTGIIQDAQDLFKQQLMLVRTEIRSDLKKTKEASQALAIGAGVGVVAVILLSLMLVYLIHWATEWPVWVCYAIVGGAFAALAGALIVAGIKKFQSFNPLPDESLEALRENLQWNQNPR